MEENVNLEFTGQPEQEPTIPEVTKEPTVSENVAEEVAVAAKAKPTRKQIPQLTEDEMVAIIKRFKESGLTRRAFCLENNYGLSSLYYWQKKYDEIFPEENPKKALIEKKKTAKQVKSAKTPKAKKETVTKAAKTKKTDTPKVEVETPMFAAEAVVEEPKRKGRTKAVKEVEVKAEVAEVMPTKRRGRPKGAKNKVKPEVTTEAPKRGRSKAKTEEPVVAASEVAPAAEPKKKPGRPPKAKVAKKVPVAKKTVKKIAPATVPAVVPTPADVPATPKATGAKRGRKPSVAPVAEPVIATGPVMQIKYPNGVRINISADISIERLKELISL